MLRLGRVSLGVIQFSKRPGIDFVFLQESCTGPHSPSVCTSIGFKSQFAGTPPVQRHTYSSASYIHRRDQAILRARKSVGARTSPPRSRESPKKDMTDNPSISESSSNSKTFSSGGHDKPLVVGRTKPTTSAKMVSSDPTTSSEAKAALNHEIEQNLRSNTGSAAPADEASVSPTAPPPTQSKKKEKAPKQPKAPKAAPASLPLSPALIDLRVGHILRCVPHPNADSLFVSTISMGDEEGAEHSQVDEETGQVVRTVCSGLNGLIPIEEMQNRKVVAVANLKPVTMRGIKSAAMVLAASPPMKEGDDPHAADRTVELVDPPDSAEAGEKVYFEGWLYGEGKGPEKQLNPKKKVWEGIQPGFYTDDSLVVGFDASKSEVGGEQKGILVVEGKGKCTVKSLKGAMVR